MAGVLGGGSPLFREFHPHSFLYIRCEQALDIYVRFGKRYREFNAFALLNIRLQILQELSYFMMLRGTYLKFA